MSKSGLGGDEVSYGDPNLRGWSGKMNAAGGGIRVATGANDRRGRSAGRHNLLAMQKDCGNDLKS